MKRIYHQEKAVTLLLLLCNMMCMIFTGCSKGENTYVFYWISTIKHYPIMKALLTLNQWHRR